MLKINIVKNQGDNMLNNVICDNIIFVKRISVFRNNVSCSSRENNYYHLPKEDKRRNFVECSGFSFIYNEFKSDFQSPKNNSSNKYHKSSPCDCVPYSLSLEAMQQLYLRNILKNKIFFLLHGKYLCEHFSIIFMFHVG